VTWYIKFKNRNFGKQCVGYLDLNETNISDDILKRSCIVGKNFNTVLKYILKFEKMRSNDEYSTDP